MTSIRKIKTPVSRPRMAMLGLIYAASGAFGTIAFFTAFILFLGNLPNSSRPWLVPSADVGPTVAPAFDLIFNMVLLTAFSLQHSLMARPFVKKAILKVIPPALERATYVHAANLAGFLVIVLWHPVPIVLWEIKNDLFETILWSGFAFGWLLLFAAAFSIDILELLGLSQAWHWSRGKTPDPLSLKTHWTYRFFEHPMYVGVLLGCWMTPYMTLGHAALAIHFSLYIALAAAYERRDLRTRFGEKYDRWRIGEEAFGRQACIPAVARIIAVELSRRLQPIADQPLSKEMRVLLAQL